MGEYGFRTQHVGVCRESESSSSVRVSGSLRVFGGLAEFCCHLEISGSYGSDWFTGFGLRASRSGCKMYEGLLTHACHCLSLAVRLAQRRHSQIAGMLLPRDYCRQLLRKFEHEHTNH